jgi:hypothetical protein
MVFLTQIFVVLQAFWVAKLGLSRWAGHEDGRLDFRSTTSASMLVQTLVRPEEVKLLPRVFCRVDVVSTFEGRRAARPITGFVPRRFADGRPWLAALH